MRHLSLSLLVLGACASDSTDSGVVDTAEVAPVSTDAGLYMIHLSPSADPYTAGAPVELGMHLMAGEVGVPGANVEVTPFMPDMGHGIDTPPTVTEGDSGMYTAAWTFPMSGLWELDIDVDGSEGVDVVTVSYVVE